MLISQLDIPSYTAVVTSEKQSTGHVKDCDIVQNGYLALLTTGCKQDLSSDGQLIHTLNGAM